MSRPKKSPENSLNNTIIFRLSDPEFLPLHAVATQAGLNPNSMARKLVLERSQLVAVQTVRKADPALLKRLETIGCSLNQLVRNAHTFGTIPPLIETTCHEIRQVVMATVEAEGLES